MESLRYTIDEDPLAVEPPTFDRTRHFSPFPAGRSALTGGPRRENVAPYPILTTAPGPMEPRVESAAGTNGTRSRRRFVWPQRITRAIFRPTRFC
jgi:hypothetical protein